MPGSTIDCQEVSQTWGDHHGKDYASGIKSTYGQPLPDLVNRNRCSNGKSCITVAGSRWRLYQRGPVNYSVIIFLFGVPRGNHAEQKGNKVHTCRNTSTAQEHLILA